MTVFVEAGRVVVMVVEGFVQTAIAVFVDFRALGVRAARAALEVGARASMVTEVVV